MANKKITEYGALAETPASGDLIEIVDVSDTTMAATGTNKRITRANYLGGVYQAGGTDVPVADGGTGASTASDARTNLGLVIGTDVQAYDADLTALAGLSGVEGDIIYRDATQWQRLAKGTASQQLRMNAGATAPEWATIASGGQTTFDAIVAASGGTHTTLSAALAAASNGWRILVLDGDTLSGAVSSTLTDLEIIGASPSTTIVLGTNLLTLSGARPRLRNLSFSASTGGILLSGTQAEVQSCYFTFTGSSDTRSHLRCSSTYAKIMDCDFLVTNASGANPSIETTTYAKVMNNMFNITGLNHNSANNGWLKLDSIGGTLSDNTFILTTVTTGSYLISAAGTSPHVNGNTIYYGSSTEDFYWCNASGTSVNIVGNLVRAGYAGLRLLGQGANVASNQLFAASGTSAIIIDVVSAPQSVITGNRIWNDSFNDGTGISITDGDDCVISGNIIQGFTTGINITASTVDRVVISGNSLDDNTTTISDSGTSTSINGNGGVPATLEKSMRYMKNTSGAAFNAGDIVTLKAVAAGNEVIRTTTAADTKIFGVATTAIADTASGYIQVAGKTTLLKVNGTTDIAIGDFITTFTTAGIGAKAAAGQTAIAIALEAYTTDDSLGVIDALIIQPRII